MEDLEKLVGINIHNDTLEVKHSSLERSSPESDYRSVCPVCKQGHLLVSRNNLTGQLRNLDYCTLCGQHFLYTDIPDNTLWVLPPARVI